MSRYRLQDDRHVGVPRASISAPHLWECAACGWKETYRKTAPEKCRICGAAPDFWRPTGKCPETCG